MGRLLFKPVNGPGHDVYLMTDCIDTGFDIFHLFRERDHQVPALAADGIKAAFHAFNCRRIKCFRIIRHFFCKRSIHRPEKQGQGVFCNTFNPGMRLRVLICILEGINGQLEARHGVPDIPDRFLYLIIQGSMCLLFLFSKP